MRGINLANIQKSLLTSHSKEDYFGVILLKKANGKRRTGRIHCHKRPKKRCSLEMETRPYTCPRGICSVFTFPSPKSVIISPSIR